jgi:hypothetical protein
MPTQTFPCPFCGKKMGVGIELLGKKVRCPHCNQILVAPAPVATAVPVVEPAPQPPPPPPPPPEPIAELPTFNLPTQEARESIFGETEEESDDVFSSSDNKHRVPEMPAEEPSAPVESPPPVAVEPAPMPMPVAVEPAPLPSPPPEPAHTPTVELNENPFAGLEFQPPPVAAVPPPPPVVVQAVPPPAPVPVPVPSAPLPVAVAPTGATPPSSAGGNPWAGMDQLPSVPAAVPAPVSVPVPVPMEASPFPEVDAPKPAQPSRAEPAAEERVSRRAKPAPAGNPMFKTGFFILAGYALLATIAAVYGLFLKSSVPATHPLSNLPDNFGEFPPAERKKTSRLPANLDADLPVEQKVAIGGTLKIGQLEIAPISVEERKLKFVLEGKTGGKATLDQTPGTAIVLKMRIKNTSDDLMIHPLDPAFNRKVTGTERIGTNLVTGKATYQGGAIEWPLGERLRRKYEEAQANDATPLKPGEAREFVVFSNANQQVVKAVKEARDGVLWRVQVRRGRIDFDGKDVPVTAIIGVEFKPSDVKTPD